MKTKEEFIKESYGAHWDNYKDIIDANGWFTNRIIGEGNDIKRDLLEVKYVGGKEKPFIFRPKSLQGIETNNGWIKIESEDDLPKEDCWCWCWCKKDFEMKLLLFFDSEYKIFEDLESSWNIEYYQPIVEPKPPLY